MAFALAVAAAGPATPAVGPAAAAATEANITRVTAALLGASQFAHHPLDEVLAGKFLDRYLERLDPDRSLFLRSDAREFAAHRASLAQVTRRAGDTRLAHAIFDRYLERLGQRTAYITDTLRTATFEFTGHDVYALDRKHAERPRDLGAARDLWREQLRLEYLQEKLAGEKPGQIVKVLTRRTSSLLETMRQTSPEGVLEIYLDSLAHVYDPHSDYLGREQMQDLAISMNLSLFGIGAKLQSRDGRCTVVELIPGGPAARSGQLHPGDRIVAVAQGEKAPVDVVNWPLARTVELIRGPKGSVVVLTIVPAGAGDDAVRKKVSLVRDEIKLSAQRAKASIVDLPIHHGATLRLGVIDLPSFYGELRRGGASHAGSAPPISATADVARLLDKLEAEHVHGVVLDLRRNGGGLLEEAISLTGLFIKRGPVVQTRGPGGDIRVASDDDPTVDYAGPLIVLTSRFSASASEIVAGALQDYGRAIIVGDPSTFGKGTVQSVVRLAPLMDRNGLRYAYDPGALKVTIRKFYRPSGASTQLRGVASDIVVPSLSAASDVGESALDNPLPWDSVPRADYVRLATVRPYLATLRADSARRVKTGAGFALVRAEAARLEHRPKTISLNEAQRRREIADVERRDEERTKTVRSLDAAAPITYDITMENVTRPGLPPPSSRPDHGKSTPPKAPGSAKGAAAPTLSNESAERDVVLHEAERIAADYVALIRHPAERGAGHARTPTAPRLDARP